MDDSRDPRPSVPADGARRLTALLAPWAALLVGGGILVMIGLVVDWLVGGSGVMTGLALVTTGVAAALMVWTDRRRGKRTPVTPGRAVRHLGLALVVVAVLIQAVPYGRAHSNPPVTGEPDWATPRTRELMVRACYGCHSNEVDWPWYSNIAPFSWITTRHVDEGREAVNYSEFATRGGSDDTIEVIAEGSMPPAYYTRFGLNSAAKLTEAEKRELIDGLRATPGITEEHEGGEGGEHEGREHEGGEHDDD